jgi:thiamine pyrophosphokinase
MKGQRAVLIGPSLELREPERRSWFRKVIRDHKIGRGDFVVGVDGGVNGLGELQPDLIIGDWDSAKPEALAKLKAQARSKARTQEGSCRVVTLPRRKDASDLHFGLQQLADPRFSELLLVGFTGGRPDHHLSNLFEIAHFAATHAKKIAAIGPEAEYHFITGSFRLKRPKGTLISVFAMGTGRKKVTEGVSMRGFDYELKNQDLEPSSRGLSNRTRVAVAEIKVRSGVLLVVIPDVR